MQPGLPSRSQRVRALEAPTEVASFAVQDPALRLRIASRTADSPGDPCCFSDATGFWCATHTARGPATLSLRVTDEELTASSWGDGAARVLRRVEGLIGGLDHSIGEFSLASPELLPALGNADRTPSPLACTLGRNADPWATLQGVILGQRVTGKEAAQVHRRLVRRWSTKAPGVDGIWLPITAATMRSLDADELVQLGCDPKRARALIAAARLPLQDLLELPRPKAYSRLLGCRGIGVWSAAKVLFAAAGDADAVWLDDVHLPHHVCWAFDGTARADDERMLEVLQPWSGHRARVIRLVEQFVAPPPRFGARMPVQTYR